MQTVTNDQIAAVLAALAPGSTDRIREAFNLGGPAKPHERPGYTFISERDKQWYPQELLKLAEAACPAWSRDDFRSSRWLRSCMEAARKLKEAHPETALAFLLRKGIQTLANDWYISVPREWQDYTLVASSDAVAEWYGPLYGSTIAGRVPRGERFPEGKIVGEDSVVVNYKFGLTESFDRELFDDDQTGQIRQRAQRLGQGMAITENAYAAIRFVGAAGSYSNLVVPASNYTTLDVNGNTITGPFSAVLHGGYGNRPVAFVALGLTPLKQAWSDLLNAKDPLNNKIIVRPDTLLHSSMDALHAPMLVAPPQGVPYYPAIVGQSGSVLGGTTTAPGVNQGPLAGFPGGVFGANPFMGLGIKPVLARFLRDWAWAVGEKGKGILFQERDPLEVIQEQAASGAAFEVDAFRFRSRRRFEVEWVGGGSRFWWLGNDGTTTGSF